MKTIPAILSFTVWCLLWTTFTIDWQQHKQIEALNRKVAALQSLISIAKPVQDEFHWWDNYDNSNYIVTNIHPIMRRYESTNYISTSDLNIIEQH